MSLAQRSDDPPVISKSEGRFGFWEMDLRDMALALSDAARAIFGLGPAAYQLDDVLKRGGRQREVERNTRLLQMASGVAHFGGWTFDAAQDRVMWSDEVCRIHEMPAGTTPTVEEALSYFAPESRTIIALGRSLGLRVLAEGVETAAQRDFLFAHGCDAYQGYLCARPLPADAVASVTCKA